MKKPTDTWTLIRFYKGVCLHNIYEHMERQGCTMTKEEVDQEIKENAGFQFPSCAHKDVTIEDMQNLIAWAFVYGDQQGITVDYPADELDGQIHLNI